MRLGTTRLYHLNVNCSDLERSRAFYRDLIGLEPLTRTCPERPQPGSAFGLDQVAWDAWILRGDDPQGVVLDLLAWRVPPPVGRPAHDPTAPGFNRLEITTPELARTRRRLTEAGVACGATVAGPDGSGGGFATRDPDGTRLTVTEGDRTALGAVGINCADLDASRRHYLDLFDLRPGEPRALGPDDATRLGLDGAVEARAQVLADAATGFGIELTSWTRPQPDRAAPRRRQANELGIFRMAWLTGQIDADHAALDARGVACYSPPAVLDMGPGLPAVRALFFDDPDGACLELIESPG